MAKLTDISEIKRIMESSGFTFSKSLGQNFLINPSVCPKMAALSGAKKGTGVIEIGPGIGVLTAELARLCDKVVAIELDSRLIPVLTQTLSGFSNVRVINADALKIDLNELIESEFAGMEVSVCANLPYYITSPVIMHLLESRLRLSALTVMVQKEAAQRLTAPLGTRDCGAVTVAVRYYSEPELLFSVSAGSFMPAPKVDSAVIRLTVTGDMSNRVRDEKLFFRIVKAAFAQRRKTLLNSLSSGLNIPKDKLSQYLDKASVDKGKRAENLLMEDYISVCNVLDGVI